jgi:phosphoribosylformylglycinamidine (FGAM) synthase-like amidotransferase family enzyme
MPHPERACSEALGNTDGRIILQSLLFSRQPQASMSEALV